MVTLKEIITQLGNKNYPVIEIRCNWGNETNKQDCLVGFCSYKDGQLESDDDIDYSLNDQFVKWEENIKGDSKLWLTVWENSYFYEEACLEEERLKEALTNE